jgi:type IV fimbrial biogenesis protein FimT
VDLLSFPVPARPCPRPACRWTGYSLTEILTTLAVAGVVVGSGVPAMQNLVYDQRLTTQVNQLLGDLYLARSESIKRGVPVVLCKSNDGVACSTTTDWRNGWLVFVDSDDDSTVDASEPVIRVQQALSAGMALRFGAFGPGTGRYVTYLSTGLAEQNGTFTFCDPRGASNARAIIITQSGRVRISSKSSDGPLSCS